MQPPKGVLVQSDGTYAVRPYTPLGVMSPELLNTVNEIVQELKLPLIKLTSGQRIMLSGIPEDKIHEVIERLGPDSKTVPFHVQGCPGTDACKFGMQDALDMGFKLQNFLEGYALPAKVKCGVSGCSMHCSESSLRDIGLVGTKKGWTLTIGGNAGKKFRGGDEYGAELSEEEVFDILGKYLDYYGENAKKKERTARFAERVGHETIKAAIL